MCGKWQILFRRLGQKAKDTKERDRSRGTVIIVGKTPYKGVGKLPQHIKNFQCMFGAPKILYHL